MDSDNNEVCRKVYFRKPVEYGCQYDNKVVVAEEVFIVPMKDCKNEIN